MSETYFEGSMQGGDELMEDRKGQWKCYSNQYEDSGMILGAQCKAPWEARMYELELPSEIQ